MGRIRTIKPEFFKHSRLFEAEIETTLPLRVAFAGIWTCCDREGRFKWRPREMKLDVLPYDDCDFSRVLDALATRGFLVKYASGSDHYGYIPSWKAHQFVNAKESKSILPEPPKNEQLDASVTRESREEHATSTGGVKEGKGKEGKGSENPPPDSGSELMAANYLLEELGVVADNGTRRIAADSIRLLAKEGGDVKTATEYILGAGRSELASGGVINRFWFTDQKYRPQKDNPQFDRENRPHPKIRLHRAGESL